MTRLTKSPDPVSILQGPGGLWALRLLQIESKKSIFVRASEFADMRSFQRHSTPFYDRFGLLGKPETFQTPKSSMLNNLSTSDSTPMPLAVHPASSRNCGSCVDLPQPGFGFRRIGFSNDFLNGKLAPKPKEGSITAPRALFPGRGVPSGRTNVSLVMGPGGPAFPVTSAKS